MKKIILGDCLEELKKLEENSIDAIITDPPYGIGFMGKEWDNFKPSHIQESLEKDGRPQTRIASTRASTSAGTYDLSLNGNQKFQLWFSQVAKECLRVLKPGGFLLSFGGTRTYHRMVCGIEDAGFEIRDQILWIYGSGFPKSLNIGKQIDKLNGKRQEEFIALGKYLKERRGYISQNQISKFFPSKTGGLTGCVSNWELGMNVPTKEQWIILKRELKLDNKFDYLIDRIEAEREVIGKNKFGASSIYGSEIYHNRKENKIIDITLPNLPEAKEWEGWGTALKPACEPIVVARKPLSEKNVALNVLKWGTGGINIDACRIGNTRIDEYDLKKRNESPLEKHNEHTMMKSLDRVSKHGVVEQGRFPANIILDEEAGKLLDEQSGESISKARIKPSDTISQPTIDFGGGFKSNLNEHSDKGGASRFFYCAKASKSERNFGMEEKQTVQQYEDKNSRRYEFRQDGSLDGVIPISKNNHPTVKPIALMEYLIKLVSREGSTILDPFIGSGTTAIACLKLNRKFIGIEKEEEYVKIAEARIKPFLEQEKLI